MSLPDSIAPNLTALWLQTAALALALVALVASWRVARRAARERRRIDGMHRDLQVFAEASTRVADTLDHLLRGTVEPATASTSSRRFVLQKARERLEQGEPLEVLADGLELCEDERRLLEFLQRAATPMPRVHVA